ncbi:MAG: sigma-54-dependent Fis family transcriptional regulator, partial [Planctomycetes bacterium]|nr:sigma-54-dependent Fis family transcriptional regulator [Planctomycetota bacterium]
VAPTQAEAEEPTPRAIADAVRETKNSGLWAASGLWRPRQPAFELTGNPEPQPLPAPLLTRSGQSILGIVAQALGSDLELTPLLELILSMLGETFSARRGYVLLRQINGGFQLRAAFDRDAPGSRRQSAVSQGVLRDVEKERRAVLLEDALSHVSYGQRESIVTEGARSVLAAPVCWHEEVVGIVYFDDKSKPGAFQLDHRDLLTACCSLIAGPIRRHAIHEARAHELQRTKAALSRSVGAEKQRARRYTNIIGRSATMGRLFSLLDRLAESSHPVLIQGESGTGKELVASAIHYNGPRADKPFVAENCAVFSETLLEAELFGHVKGAFTGADQTRVGLIEAADGGTLFLDEIGEMSPSMQAKLLRVLQEGELRPVGGHEIRKVDLRLICASHRDLRKMVSEGTFREDLYYRVAVMTVDVPPLRERMEDIPLLVDHFLARAASEAGRAVPGVTRESLQLLCHYEWPGNVRELENECKKLVTLTPDEVTPADLSPKLLGDSIDRPNSALRKLAINEGADAMLLMIERGKSLAAVTEEIEIELIRRVLGAVGGNRSETARRLGLSRPGLLKKMKRHGIE